MKGFDRPVVSEAVSFLKQKGVINDAKFAKLWVESRMRSNPRGTMLLRKELRSKGIGHAATEDALAGGAGSERAAVIAVARKKAAGLRGLPEQTAKKRLFGHLARRGFDFGMIEDAVREAIVDDRR
jgi:regulatory protein